MKERKMKRYLLFIKVFQVLEFFNIKKKKKKAHLLNSYSFVPVVFLFAAVFFPFFISPVRLWSLNKIVFRRKLERATIRKGPPSFNSNLVLKCLFCITRTSHVLNTFRGFNLFAPRPGKHIYDVNFITVEFSILFPENCVHWLGKTVYFWSI